MKTTRQETAPEAATPEKARSDIKSPKHRDIDNFDHLVEFAEEVKIDRDQPLSEELMDFASKLEDRFFEKGHTYFQQAGDFFELQLEINGGEYPLEKFIYQILRVWHTDPQLLNARGREPEVEEVIRRLTVKGEGSILHQIEMCQGFDLKKFMTQWFLNHKSDPITLWLTQMYALFMAQRPAWV